MNLLLGLVAPFIFGGQDVSLDDPVSRSVVAIMDHKKFTCTATLIAENMALTAAHCFDEKMLLSFGLVAEDKKNARRNVLRVGVPEQYRGDVNDHLGDIAVLYFEGGLPAGYRSVEILADDVELLSGQSVVQVGYGNLNAGRVLNGMGVLRKTLSEISVPNFSETELSIDQVKGRGACFGDSGGPLLVSQGLDIFVAGVTSRYKGFNCASEMVYTKARSYRAWIEEQKIELPRLYREAREKQNSLSF